MADSEFSSVHWDSPPPSSLPEPAEPNNTLLPTNPPTQTVPPDMDPLQAPPANEHTLICVINPGSLRHSCARKYRLRKKRQMAQKMHMYRILSQQKYVRLVRKYIDLGQLDYSTYIPKQILQG